MSAVEVEKKFLLDDVQKQRLLEGAEPTGSKVITDSYLDSADYQLTKADYWLRVRDGAFELKAPFVSGSGSYEGTNRYRELTDTEDILTELKLPTEAGIESALATAGITAFCICQTERQSYQKEGFTIDIDSATYPGSDFTYAVAEIELLVDDESQADAVEERILAFANKHDLSMSGIVLGKIAAFLQVEALDHYRQLVEVGVLK
jgi:adenylate cyclase class IV